MDAMQIALPVLGIVAAAVVTFYAVSFNEIREVIIIKQYYIKLYSILSLYESYKIELLHRNHFQIGMNLNRKIEILDDDHPVPDRGELKDKLVKITKPNFNLSSLSFHFFVVIFS